MIRYNGTKFVAPVDRYAVIPEVIIWTAVEALPVKASKTPCHVIPHTFQKKVPLSSASEATSSNCALAAA